MSKASSDRNNRLSGKDGKETDNEMTKMLWSSDWNVNMNKGEDMCKELPHKSKGPPWYKSKRYILAYILFGGVVNSFLQRGHFGIVLVCMVNHTAISSTVNVLTNRTNNNILEKNQEKAPFQDVSMNKTSLSGTDNTLRTKEKSLNALRIDFIHHTQDQFVSKTVRDNFVDIETKLSRKLSNKDNEESCLESGRDKKEAEDGPFAWDKRTQGLLLGAVYWMFAAIPLGNTVIRYFSQKRIIAVSSVIVCGLTMLTHVAAMWSPWTVFAVKLVQGAFTGVKILSIYGMWTHWAPPLERAGLFAITFGGAPFAVAIVFPISGLLCKYGFWGGWPSVFYFFGLVGLVWSLIFILFTSESPAEHPSITPEEKDFIEKSLSLTVTKSKKPPIPWLSIFLSPAVWAVICIQSSFSWGFFVVMSTMPQYMKEVLKFKIDSNGFFMMIPFLTTWILSLIEWEYYQSHFNIGKNWSGFAQKTSCCHC